MANHCQPQEPMPVGLEMVKGMQMLEWKDQKLECGSNLKPGLHLNANDTCGREVRQNVWYIHILIGIRRGSESTLHKRVVCEFSLKN